MKQNKLCSLLKTKRFYLGLALVLSSLILTCRNHEKRAERDNLDKQISCLDQEIKNTKDLRTARLPKHLQTTQKNYNKICDSLSQNLEAWKSCINTKDSLITRAFNDYAIRVGRNFQISKYLSKADIAVFQQQLGQMDAMDFVKEMARQRILNNFGSLHDLSYFIELVDFSINEQLENKLAWHFYPDTLNITDGADTNEISVLNFENESLNKALQLETSLLNRAWTYKSAQNTDNKDSVLSTDTDSLSVIYTIPEFDSIDTKSLDSAINNYETLFIRMGMAEDTLTKYIERIKHERDSLVLQRNQLFQ